MYVSLVTYVETQRGNSTIIKAMLEQFSQKLPPPINQTHHYSRHAAYQEWQYLPYQHENLTQLANIISETISYCLKYDGRSALDLALKNHLPKQCNILEFYMLAMSSYFELFDVGSSGHRVSYAATFLREALPESIKIRITSNTKRDLILACIGSKKTGYYVYDPSLNPTLLFEHEYYKKNILTLIPESYIKVKRFDLMLQHNTAAKIKRMKPYTHEVICDFIHRIDLEPEILKDVFSKFFYSIEPPTLIQHLERSKQHISERLNHPAKKEENDGNDDFNVTLFKKDSLLNTDEPSSTKSTLKLS